MTVGPVEMALGLALVIFLFGHRWLPRVARGLAQAPAAFVRGRRED